MKKLKLVAVSLVTFISLASQAELREILKMREMAPAIDQNTLVVFDLDNTVIEPTQTLGTDQWFGYLVKKNIDAGMDEKTAVANAIVPWTQVQNATLMTPVERTTPAFIHTLQENGIRVMGLTARPESLVSRTLTQLKNVGVDFSLQPIHDHNTRINDEPGAVYVRGIVFLGPNGDKGHTLVNFLKQINKAPPKIVFIDDKLRNVKSVEGALDPYSRLQHISFRYGFDDEKVAHFNPAIAEVEWTYFNKFHKLITDQEAEEIINR